MIKRLLLMITLSALSLPVWAVSAGVARGTFTDIPGIGPIFLGEIDRTVRTPPDVIDASTIKGKVLCGYQGWFQTPGDGAGNRWGHWSINSERIGPDTLTIDMWPDMTEYPKSEWVPASNMKHKDGRQAYLFSSARPKVADLHFRWMRDYGIDGVFMQRFVVGLRDSNRWNTTKVLGYGRDAANKYGRVFSITYDMSGAKPEEVYDLMVNDWKFLVDEMKITKDKRWLRQNGKPVLEIYGWFQERMPAATANKIIDFFKNDPKYGVFLVGSGAWWWRSIEDPEWGKVFRRLDMISPWNVGNWAQTPDGTKTAGMGHWVDDLKEARKTNMMYLPVVYPGFSWKNLQTTHGNPQGGANPLPRRGGEFLKEQFAKAIELKTDAIFMAMFDEVDEGTAIFKVTNDPPADAPFQTYDGLPSDTYLRIVGEQTKLYRNALKTK